MGAIGDASAIADLLRPSELTPLDGSEPLGPVRVLDFWRWALGDLRMNNARGYLAEFLVARAVGDARALRVEWGPYDVEAADGTRIEVKAAGRLQSWATARLTTPTWSFKSVKAATVWAEDRGEYIPVDPSRRVDVWVFALQTAVDPALYDALDVQQWEFRVIAHRELLATGQVSARLSLFDRLGVEPGGYAQLPAAVIAARARNAGLA